MRKRRSGDITLFLGEGCSLKGDLHFTGRARLDGEFEGDVRGDGDLVIGLSANVKGDISVSNIVISGKVEGNIQASNRLEVKAPSQVRGDISAPLVVIDEGVLFEGHCRMAESMGQGHKLSVIGSTS